MSWGVLSGGFLSGVYVRGVFVRGVFVLEPYFTMSVSAKTNFHSHLFLFMTIPNLLVVLPITRGICILALTIIPSSSDKLS